MLDTHFQIGCKYPSPHVSFFNSGHLWTTAVNVQRQTYHQLCSSVFLVRLCYQTINPILLLCRLFVNISEIPEDFLDPVFTLCQKLFNPQRILNDFQLEKGEGLARQFEVCEFVLHSPLCQSVCHVFPSD